MPNTTILSAAVNQNFTDIATGLSNVLTRDGQAGMTAAFKAISGALGTPGITFTADTTSGLYLSASGVPGFVAHSLGMLLNTNVFAAQSATVQAGGSGYAVGDIITVTGGTSIAQAIFTVATLSGSAVSTVTIAYSGFYTATATNPVSQGSTSGSGTGCTLNVTYNNPGGADYRALFTDQAGAFLWQKFGASPFVSGLMGKANGVDFANGIGGSALAQAIGGALVIPPQGVLSPISSTTNPFPSSDTTGQTNIYWTPWNGSLCPIYNGVSFVPTTSGQLVCALTSGAQVLNGIYDVYKFLVSGVVTLGLSPSWAAGTGGSVAAGACARGTGAGGTAHTIINGIRTNAVAMTLNNGATTYNIAANQATYLGSVYINATGVAGQYNCHISAGQNRVWGLWNAYNQRRLTLQCVDPTAQWNYTSTTIRPSNNASNNSIYLFTGLADIEPQVTFNQTVIAGSISATSQVIATWQVGIGWNSSTVMSGTKPQGGGRLDGSSVDILFYGNSTAEYVPTPFLGLNVATSLEATTGANGSPTVNYQGQAAGMLLKTVYWG